MTKLNWSRASQRYPDPARVIEVDDYFPDRLVVRKGNSKTPKKKAKKKHPKNKSKQLSVNLKSPQKPIQKPAKVKSPQKPIQKPAKVKNTRKKKAKPLRTGGLSIPEMMARSRGKVGRITSDIQKTERKLADLREKLKLAERELQRVKDTPRRSALGQALHKAQKGLMKI